MVQMDKEQWAVNKSSFWQLDGERGQMITKWWKQRGTLLHLPDLGLKPWQLVNGHRNKVEIP